MQLFCTVKGYLTTIALFLFIVSTTVLASPVETFEFKDEATKLRFQVLSKELRCPKCQNQNLADSNSPIAADLRLMVYKQLQEGKSDQEVIDYMVYRYGDFVLYRPQVNSLTYVLWFGPLVLVLLFGGGIIFIVRKRAKNSAQSEVELTEDDKANLNDLLNK